MWQEPFPLTRSYNQFSQDPILIPSYYCYHVYLTSSSTQIQNNQQTSNNPNIYIRSHELRHHWFTNWPIHDEFKTRVPFKLRLTKRASISKLIVTVAILLRELNDCKLPKACIEMPLPPTLPGFTRKWLWKVVELVPHWCFISSKIGPVHDNNFDD